MNPVVSIETINNEEYIFIKNGSEMVHTGHDITENYAAKLSLFQSNFNQNISETSNEINEKSFLSIKNVLPPQICQKLIDNKNDKNFNTHATLQQLLPQILNDNIDNQIKHHFKSDYAVAWCNFAEVDSSIDESGYFTKWHCDSGPSKHLKIIVYLNSVEKHGGNTFFYEKNITKALKEKGYIFCDIRNRKKDISGLLDHLGLDSTPKQFELNAGDAIIFNPLEVAHRCDVPQDKKTRYTIGLCIVPSPIPWDEVNQQHWSPEPQTKRFAEISKMISLLPINDCLPPKNGYVLLSQKGGIQSKGTLKYFLNNIFSDQEYVDTMYERIMEFDPNLNQVNHINKLIELLKNSFQTSIPWDGIIQSDNVKNLLELANFQESALQSFDCYRPEGKPNPKAVFWPNPIHPSAPQNKFEQLPYVIKHPIMTKATPIGSAGSCFAAELSKVLQEERFNYTISERITDPDSPVIVDGYTPGEDIVKFCANYGIIFNSPSFTQLAEKAFNKNKQQKLLIPVQGGLYTDPYRENVFFKSVKAYKDDYQNHVEALKQTFLTCEVFVITLGLNECWMLKDGTVLSRNPKSGMEHLIKHKILTVSENVAYIQKFFDIIKEHNPKFKLIVTLSPIPFLATGRGNTHHVIEANTHSKAVLRVAAEELVQNNEDIYYLPSYELVTECSQQPWEADHRHVTHETVKRVINMFKEIFVVE